MKYTFIVYQSYNIFLFTYIDGTNKNNDKNDDKRRFKIYMKISISCHY